MLKNTCEWRGGDKEWGVRRGGLGSIATHYRNFQNSKSDLDAESCSVSDAGIKSDLCWRPDKITKKNGGALLCFSVISVVELPI